MDTETFQKTLKTDAAAVEALLSDLLADRPLEGERLRPATLLAAMRHGVLNGGKRMRPALVIQSARLFDGNPQTALHIAAALECIHCYSLIHDDLPAMDDDDLRRGQPTVHKAFDEATAILAGDSLLTMAFDIVASAPGDLDARLKLDLVRALSRAAGMGGMAGGQALDLQAERLTPDEQGIIDLQAMKTGALIRFACQAGAMLSGATHDDIARLTRFGAIIGLAFQLRDDLLDLTADAATMGKATGKDAARGKGTLVSIHGADWTHRKLADLTAEAGDLLKIYGDKAATLLQLALYVANREH